MHAFLNRNVGAENEWSYTSTALRTVRPVQSLSACTRVHFFFTTTTTTTKNNNNNNNYYYYYY